MRKNGLTSVLFILLVLLSSKSKASFYSTLNKVEYTYDNLLAKFSLVILISKDCQACKILQYKIQKCSLPNNFKVAWVGSHISKYKFHKNNFEKIKTSERVIEKITQVTPKTILMGHTFKEGVFNCKDLEKSIY